MIPYPLALVRGLCVCAHASRRVCIRCGTQAAPLFGISIVVWVRMQSAVAMQRPPY